jgi:hypothetical protein
MFTTGFNHTIRMLAAAMLLLFLLPDTVFGQSSSELRRQKREAAREMRQLEFEKAREAINNRSFAMPAESIQFRNRNHMPIMSNINFLVLDGDFGVLQIGPGFSHSRGLNNLGGVTLEGNVTNLRITEKRNQVILTYNLTGVVATVRITLTIAGSASATVDVDGLYGGKAFTLRGQILDLSETNFFRGTEF